VFVFFAGLPLILSSSLGYKFDRRNFKFSKTGLIVLKTQPQGASIYFDGRLVNDKTPATLDELLPGKYNLRLTLKDHYPWQADVRVEAGKVSRFEKIILFPLRSNVKQLNKERISAFWVDQDKGTVYYVNQQDSIIYRSDLNGDHYEKLTEVLAIFPPPVKWVISPDKERLLYFNDHQIGLAYLQPRKEMLPLESPFILNYARGKIVNVFWYSDSYHLILVSDKSIEVLEAKPESLPMTLVTLAKKNPSIFYDTHSDTLYFLDYQTAADGNIYNNLYKLELSTKNFALQELIKLKPPESNE
jgi:hypothetical protein